MFASHVGSGFRWATPTSVCAPRWKIVSISCSLTRALDRPRILELAADDRRPCDVAQRQQLRLGVGVADERDDRGAPREQVLDEPRADDAGRAGDERPAPAPTVFRRRRSCRRLAQDLERVAGGTPSQRYDFARSTPRAPKLAPADPRPSAPLRQCLAQPVDRRGPGSGGPRRRRTRRRRCGRCRRPAFRTPSPRSRSSRSPRRRTRSRRRRQRCRCASGRGWLRSRPSRPWTTRSGTPAPAREVGDRQPEVVRAEEEEPVGQVGLGRDQPSRTPRSGAGCCGGARACRRRRRGPLRPELLDARPPQHLLVLDPPEVVVDALRHDREPLVGDAVRGLDVALDRLRRHDHAVGLVRARPVQAGIRQRVPPRSVCLATSLTLWIATTVRPR